MWENDIRRLRLKYASWIVCSELDLDGYKLYTGSCTSGHWRLILHVVAFDIMSFCNMDNGFALVDKYTTSY